ncbi:flagellar hook-length control protein [Candidatus Scalindua japonica]|uniref:Flagellar hook-length control protein n=1 Tax=Candidatus Scalindua japonica TaxID=1284222 RepID=A0A286TV91_9BACT|nr:flagellar hook-length control protein FliK [Candidatus Scalindua japonica]GAX59803.1 flagellar hook-length control protein [Candidatus Scalindua japonica]
MADKSISPLSGILSTKDSPASGIFKTTNNSIKNDREENGFLSKLVNTIQSTDTLYRQPDTDIQSELNDKTNTEDIYQLLQLLSMGTPTNLVTNTETRQSMPGKELTNMIINNNANTKAPSTLLENTILSNQELKPFESLNSSFSKNTRINTAHNLAGELILEEPSPSISGKLNTNQTSIPQSVAGQLNLEQPVTSVSENSGSTNIAQELMNDSITEQPATSLSDKSNVTQNSTKADEQRVLDTLNKPDLPESSPVISGDKPVLQISKLPAMQALKTTKESGINPLNRHSVTYKNTAEQTTVASKKNINQNTTNIQPNREPVSLIANRASNPIPDAYKIANNKIINSSALPVSEERTDGKASEILKGQHQDQASLTNIDKKPQTQQGVAQTKTENNETPIMFDVSTNTSEAKAEKTLSSTSLTNNSISTVSVEATTSPNTSSDNSTLNNQETNTHFDYEMNPVNTGKRTETDTNFKSTLSQISNSAKPLDSLGNDIADNIIQNAKSFTQGGKSELKMQLSPPELGTLKLEFTVEDDILETKITVERSSVKDVIEKDIPRLRELISNADIDVGKLDVYLQDKENDKMGFMNKDFQSDSKSKNTQNPSNEEDEYRENTAEEETTANNTKSTQINYLV